MRRLLLAVGLTVVTWPIASAAQPVAPSTAWLLARVATLEQELARVQILAASCAVPIKSMTAPAPAQTLAGASAAAAQITHSWPASTGAVPVYDPAKAAAFAIETASTAPSNAPIASKGDEAHWKGRMRVLVTKLENDRGFLAAAIVRERTLYAQVHSEIGVQRRRSAVAENYWQASVAEVSR